MKRNFIITLLLFVCSIMSYGQNSFFDKYADMDGITSIYISKSMLSMMPNMKTEGINIGKIASKLDNIQILTCEKPSLIPKIKKELEFINPKNGYESLVRINDEGEKSTIYQKTIKKDKKEFVLIVAEKSELTIIVITGNLNLEEMQGIINKK